MNSEEAAAELRYTAWRGARVAAYSSMPIGALSILGAAMLGVGGVETQQPAVIFGALIYAIAQIGVVLAGYLLFRARGALELIQGRLLFMAVAGGLGLVAAASCALPIRTLIRTGPGFLHWVPALVPTVPCILAVAISGFPLVAFRRVWQEGRDELRSAELG